MTDTLDLDELERRARVATPGPWAVREFPNPGLPSSNGFEIPDRVDYYIDTAWDHPQAHGAVPVVTLAYGLLKHNPGLFIREDDAQFIAAANPATVLSLIARLRDAEERAERAEARIVCGACGLKPSDSAWHWTAKDWGDAHHHYTDYCGPLACIACVETTDA